MAWLPSGAAAGPALRGARASPALSSGVAAAVMLYKRALPPSSPLHSARPSAAAQRFFCQLLERGASTVYLGRWVHSATCSVSVDDRPHVELTDGSNGELLQKREMVGAFQRIPMVMPATDILMSAQRKSRNVPPTKGIQNIAKRERNKGAKQLDALMKELSVPLRTYTENFPRRRDLHPYERSLIELTFGEGYYEKVLGRVDALRKKITSVGKQHASVCAKSLTKREAEERLTEGRKELEEVFQRGQNAIEDLINVAKALRSMPVVDPHIPTLCLVGSPNVGKSSLVRILSTGKPEVCSYPFTTRGILMGHIVSNHERFQVTDTPGLLTRHDDDRNNIERLTLAVLSYMPIAVLYVHDLSEDCGTKVADQYITYKHIKERFGDRLWIDVVSKCDLLDRATPSRFDDAADDGVDDELRRYREFGPEDAIRVSVQSQIGTQELKQRVHHLLTSQRARIKAAESDDEGVGEVR
ncbi:nucleolar GTP-binding protein 1-like [Triticum dicoccoides]|uniref:nucleolar GTP-binding protein 1-like n=1 Tax=Triticum dicoccoides TaxID=85692 RepID=UPI001891BCF6|nr:nucleolar GTP-binding protein 1-like [Triticum dicoccoides]